MNQSRSGRKLFRKRNARELLPLKPVAKMMIEPWWIVHIGSITEDDIKVRLSEPAKKIIIIASIFSFPILKVATDGDKALIDRIIDNGSCKAGTVNYNDLHNLYGYFNFF